MASPRTMRRPPPLQLLLLQSISLAALLPHNAAVAERLYTQERTASSSTSSSFLSLSRRSTPPCRCNACEASHRSSPLQCGARFMCEPEPLSLSEGMLCVVPPDSSLMPGDAGMGVPKQKFCLNSCVPQQDAKSLALKLDDLCSEITEEQMELIPADPNGVDPACIIAHLESLAPGYKPVAVEGGAADASAAETSEAAAAGGEAEAEAPLPRATEQDLKHLHANALKTEAVQLRLRAAHAATKAEEAAAEAQQSLVDTQDAATRNENAVAELKSLLVQTKMYKEAAWKARSEAAAIYGEMQHAAEDAANAAVRSAVAEVNADLARAQKFRDENIARFTPSSKPIPITTPAAARAMAPYDAVTAAAKKARSAHAGLAKQLNAQAGQVQENAKTTLEEAFDYHGGNEEALAEQYHAQAVEMFKKAGDLQAAAVKHQGVAASIGGVLGSYGALATHAGLHADDRAGPEIPWPKGGAL